MAQIRPAGESARDADMRWLLRVLAWATVLAVPSWWIGGAYHRLLATLSLGLLGIPSDRIAFQPPEIPASHVLGVYAALCLASTHAPRARRFAALAVGLVVMVAVEVLTGTLAIRWELEGATGAGLSATAMRLRDYLTSLPAWIGAPVVWLLLLGRYELPAAAPRGRGASKPHARAPGAPLLSAPPPTPRRRDPGGPAGPTAG
jgi:hypothetical protein